MLALVQRLFQILFIGLLILLAVKPDVAPLPARPYTTLYSRFIVGDSITFASFTKTWNQRWQLAAYWLPQLKNMKAPWPEPPDPITGDWILQVMNSTFIEGPLYKWSNIKNNLTVAPIAPVTVSPTASSSASPSAEINR